MFSVKRLRALFSYGWKLLASSLIDILYKNSRQLVIGKLYSSSDLAYYNKGRQFPNYVITNINSAIDSVLFPVLSKVQDDRQDVRKMTRKSIKVSAYIMAPLMMGLAFSADSVVRLLLTDKWIECVPYLRIFCITFMFWPIHTANLNAIKAMGRSDLFLKLEILKKCVGVILLLATMWFGPMAMAYSMLISSIASQIINSWPNRKLLGYSYAEQIKDVLSSILLAVAMGMAVWCVSLTNLPVLIVFIVQVLLGAVIYVAGSAFFRIEAYVYLKKLLGSFVEKK